MSSVHAKYYLTHTQLMVPVVAVDSVVNVASVVEVWVEVGKGCSVIVVGSICLMVVGRVGEDSHWQGYCLLPRNMAANSGWKEGNLRTTGFILQVTFTIMKRDNS